MKKRDDDDDDEGTITYVRRNDVSSCKFNFTLSYKIF